jgi:uncharacterized membrane protein
MAQLIAITYPDQARAAETLEMLRRLSSAHIVELDDACVVTKDADGKIRLNQTVNVTARGAVGGAFWGSLIGLLFLNPLVGMAAGAAAGALTGALTDYGISDAFMRSLAAAMPPRSSAVFMLLRSATMDRLEADLARFGGTLLHTSLSVDAEARLRTVLADPAGPGADVPPAVRQARDAIALPPADAR